MTAYDLLNQDFSFTLNGNVMRIRTFAFNQSNCSFRASILDTSHPKYPIGTPLILRAYNAGSGRIHWEVLN